MVGRGRLGRSLVSALTGAGCDATLLAARGNEDGVVDSLTHAGDEPSVVFLAIPDGALRSYSSGLAARRPHEGTLFAHLSGALGLDALEPVRDADYRVGSFHPLQSFGAEREPEAFRGIAIAVDAQHDDDRDRLAEIARCLGARPRLVPDEQRALYHAAAVIASNYLVVLVAVAVKILETAGWRREDAIEDLLPLMEGSLANVRTTGVPGALTGPIRRGDVETVTRNLEALQRESADGVEVYRIVGLAAVELARQAGLSDADAAQIRTALTRPGQRPGGAT